MTDFSHKTLVFRTVLVCLFFGVNAHSFAAKPSPTKKECNDALVATTDINLKFGTFDGTPAGTITIDPMGSRSSAGLVFVGGTYSVASFSVSSTITGCNIYPVKITLPKNNKPSDLTGGSGAVMTASFFTSDPADSFNIDASAYVSTQVDVGATLTTNVLQAGGAYTTVTPFTVQFKY